MLSRTDKQISPEVRTRKKSAAACGQPAAVTSKNPSDASFAELVAEMKRQWERTTQMNLPVLRVVKTTNE